MAVGGVEYVQVCKSFSESQDGSISCNGVAYVQAYLLPADAESTIGLLLNGGFSEEAATRGFLGVMTLFAAGLATGVVISMLRRLRYG